MTLWKQKTMMVIRIGSEGAAMIRKRREMTIKVRRAGDTVAGRSSLVSRASSRRRWRARRRRVHIRKNVEIRKYGRAPGCPFFAIATETDRSICHNSECRRRVDVQCVTTQLEPSVSKNPRDGKVKWGQDRTWSWARAVAAGLQPRRAAKRTHLTKNGRRCSFAEFCNSSQRAHPSSLRKEKRPRWQKSFALGGLRQVAACSTCFLRLFSTFGTGWNLNGPARLAKCWTTLEERMVVIGS